MIKELKYEANISLIEAQNRINEIQIAYETVQKNYSGLFSRFKKEIKKEDLKTLEDCIGVLIPLSMQPSVQREIKSTENSNKLILNQSSQLQNDILQYITRFENSPVKIYKGINLF